MKRWQFQAWMIAGVLCLGIAGSASSLFAKRGGGGGYGAGGGGIGGNGKYGNNSQNSQNPQNQSQNQTPQTSDASSTPTTGPSNDTNDELQKDHDAMVAAADKVKRAFEAKPDWTDAEESVRKAQADYHTASAAAMSGLNINPDYAAASDKFTKVELKLDQAREAGPDGSPDIVTAATDLMTARSALTDMQSKVLAADPAVITAKISLATASTRLDLLQKGELAAVQADPDWQTAKKAYDDAKAQLASAAK